MHIESLHNHTKTSDGTQDYLEILQIAEKLNYGVIAFTDHDAIPDENTINHIKTYNGPVKWFLGVEISSGLPKELGGKPSGLFHILGLFIDPTNEALRNHCHFANKARVKRMEQMVKNLQNLGFKITEDDCLKASGGESVGRPHIVTALNQYPENTAIIESLKNKMEKAAKDDMEINNQYMEMIERGLEKYPYYLFLTEKSFIKNIYVDYLYYLDMDQSVKLIRDAGGVAILAHWGTIKWKINEEMLRQFLNDKRLDGLEIASLYEPAQELECKKNTDTLRNLSAETDCLITIGIDAHRPEDYELFSKIDEAKESIGMTKKIIKKTGPSLEWSNIKI